MSTRHFFPDTIGLVDTALRGIVTLKPSLRLIPTTKVIFDSEYDSEKVALIAGGGAGHEPAHSGYVGKGMLAAGVSGDIFASPSAKQVESAIAAVPSRKGTILIITNYTGDILHFGLAAENALATSRGKIGKIVVHDDVAVGRKQGGLVGRRALAGTILVEKLLGGASLAGKDFDYVMALGTSVTDNLASIQIGLEHCHVPGRAVEEDEFDNSLNQCEIGMGLHNEPGFRKISPIPSAPTLLREVIKMLTDQDDVDRAFVPFKAGDEVVLFVNNMGGLSVLELNAFTKVALDILTQEVKLKITRIFVGSFMTSCNGPGAGISLLNLTNIHSSGVASTAEVLGFIDAPTNAINWPTTQEPLDLNLNQIVEDKRVEEEKVFEGEIIVDPKLLQGLLKAAATNMVNCERDLTIWDTKMGDGDCGETVSRGGRTILKGLEEGLGAQGKLLHTIHALSEMAEIQMGGTLGAIFGIFITGLLTGLQFDSSKGLSPREALVKASSYALDNLLTLTPARVGDRTVLDVLIPFVAEFTKQGDIQSSAKVAHDAAEGTRKIKPRLGRATYVGGLDDAHTLVPDPGAWALWEIVKGFAEVQN